MASPSMTCLLLLLPSLLLGLSHAANFYVTNNCGYTVWPAAIPAGGGQQLDPGQTWQINVPVGTTSGRVWARTSCNFDGSGHGSCQTGDCGGVLSCTLSGQPPATLAEFSLNQPNNLDFYDISVIDGFNVPMDFAPTNGACHDIRCLADNTAQCPDGYFHPNDVKTFSCPSGTDYKVTFCP